MTSNPSAVGSNWEMFSGSGQSELVVTKFTVLAGKSDVCPAVGQKIKMVICIMGTGRLVKRQELR